MRRRPEDPIVDAQEGEAPQDRTPLVCRRNGEPEQENGRGGWGSGGHGGAERKSVALSWRLL